MKELIKKIAEAKKEIGKISKDSTNPFYKSKYFDINQMLEHVEPILEKHGLMMLQPIVDNKVCSRIYDVESGEYIESCMCLSDIKDPQKRGSEVTYYRRYTGSSLLALQAEDDDGNKTVTSKQSQDKSDKKEPENWLNIYTSKDKTDITKEFKDCHKAIHEGVDGNKFTVQDIRKKYKVSKAVAKELENEFFFTNDLPFD